MRVIRVRMRGCGQAWLAGLVMFMATGVLGAAEPVQLRVLCYNIHHGEGVDGKLDLQRIAKVIQSVEPDLVTLQEVDQKASRSGSVDQPAELARLTGMQVAFGPNIPLQGGHYGNAVLSKYPIVDHRNRLLPNFDDGEQRGVLSAELQIPGLDQPLLLLATHLDSRRNDRERIASAKAINQIVSKTPERSALLAGDMNDVLNSPTLDELETKWTRVNERVMPTIPVAKPQRQIDFILFRPSTRWKLIEVKVLDEVVASDHRPIFAVLELIR
ncbi:endonuclease/exonuclease/phosphatase family protein [Rhodopirellula sp. P2]|uniref:endonuclease/exonuclease/phosphatase family protein n=1 Tax=Rhodopirellula sp. P2 TaxID=2127060 RepID=UPI002368D424|nr:endonuclease/exonuclease/phosphatase family protein [Rhodopirellula sp. P2]WDQ15362.1 endonuclease/exonuclease/phosphatase family protein [Rhodopirellula sp. P2]